MDMLEEIRAHEQLAAKRRADAANEAKKAADAKIAAAKADAEKKISDAEARAGKILEDSKEEAAKVRAERLAECEKLDLDSEKKACANIERAADFIFGKIKA